MEDDNNVISRGACGAFIHGLEDEFRQVRLAAVDSLCELASKEQSGTDVIIFLILPKTYEVFQ